MLPIADDRKATEITEWIFIWKVSAVACLVLFRVIM